LVLLLQESGGGVFQIPPGDCSGSYRCGLSDKPQDYEYTLKQHIDNLEKLVTALALKDFVMVVHDWGGAIGFGLIERHPEWVQK